MPTNATRLKFFAAMTLLAVIACALMGCAGARPKPITARCNEQPQWTTKNTAGQDVGIFVCFGEENRLLYAVRILPPAPPAPAAAQANPTTAAAPKPAPKRKNPMFSATGGDGSGPTMVEIKQ